MVGDKVLWSPECQWWPPPPLRQNSPFAAQLKIAFRRFLFTRGISWGYYMAAQRHKISLEVLKNMSRVSAPFELLYGEFKVTKCCIKTFCLCWLIRSKISVMCCVTFSNVLYVFGSFMNTQLGHVYISACLHLSYWDHKICWKVITIRLFSIF